MLMVQDQDKDYGVNGVIIIIGELPGGPVVRTLYFHCWGPRFNPQSGNYDPTGCAEQPNK